MVTALAATVVLGLRDALAGPTLLGSGSAPAETMLVIIVGSVFGGLLAALRRRRASDSTEPESSTMDSV
jgi:hypothetical protein